jgi:hypothetical protein
MDEAHPRANESSGHEEKNLMQELPCDPVTDLQLERGEAETGNAKL